MPTIKGTKFSKAHRNNISLAHMGLRRSEETKRKISATMTGRKRGPYKKHA